MFVLYDFLLLMLFFVLFLIAYFSIQRIKHFAVIAKLLSKNAFSGLFEGAIYAALALAFDLFMEFIYNDVSISFYYVQFIVLLTISDVKVASYSLLPALIYRLISSDINAENYLLTGIVFSFSLAIIIAKNLITKFDYRVIIFPLFLMVSAVAYVIFWAALDLIDIDSWVYIVYTMFGAVIVQLLVSYAVKISVSANVLHSSINFNFLSFYRASFVKSVVGDTIKASKIHTGIYGIFNIFWSDNGNEMENKEILEAALENIENAFPKSAILFHVESDSYGFFLPWEGKVKIDRLIKGNVLYKREPNDSLVPLWLLLKTASRNIKISTGRETNINIKAGVSIYGVQSSSLSELHNNAVFASGYLINNNRNQISVFDQGEHRQRILDIKNVKALDDLISLSTIETVCTKIKIGDEEFMYVTAKQKWDEEYIKDLYTYVSTAGLMQVFDRYVAIEAIRNADGVKVIVPYSPNAFRSGHDISKFLLRLELLGMPRKNLVLNFDIKKEKYWAVSPDFISLLKKEGIRISTVVEEGKTDMHVGEGIEFDIILTNEMINPKKNVVSNT